MMTPVNEAELADAIASATGPLHVKGGGTRPVGRPQTGTTLSTRQMSGISLYEPGALTLVAQAGTPVADIKAALEKEGQRLAFEPVDYRALLGTTGTPTIGAVVATNNSGPRRIAVGAARDFALGVRFVDGTGCVMKNGGRVMKNVTGYDLVKLLSGSHGTLGVLSEVSLKVLPKPETTACVLLQGLNDQTAIQAMSAALGSPFEVTGAAHIPVGLDGTPVTMIRIEGFENSVKYRSAQLIDLLGRFGPADITPQQDSDGYGPDAGWQWVRDVTAFADRAGDVWRLSIKPSDAPELVQRMQADGVIYDWGGGLIWALTSGGTDLRARLGAFAGHATLVRASDKTRNAVANFQPESAPLAMLTQGLRAKFDPRGLLNPGLMD